MLCCFFILCIKIVLINGYCWQVGWNPTFTGNPTIIQNAPTSVQISWKNIIKTRECADQFMVKYWESHSPKSYKMSKQVANNADAMILTGIKPEVEYSYQVIAREDKGIIGVDYNKSKISKFRSRRKFTPRIDNQAQNLNIAVSNGEVTRDEIINNVVVPVIDNDSSPNEPSSGFSYSHFINHSSSSSSKSTIEASVSGVKTKNVNKMWMLALFIVGGVVVILLIFGVTYNCIRRLIRKNKDKNQSRLQLMNNDSSERRENAYEKQDNNPDHQDSLENKTESSS